MSISAKSIEVVLTDQATGKAEGLGSGGQVLGVPVEHVYSLQIKVDEEIALSIPEFRRFTADPRVIAELNRRLGMISEVLRQAEQ